MFQIQARSRFLNLQNSFRLNYVLAAGAFLSILSFVLYKDLIVTITTIACSIISYILLGKPPQDIVVGVGDSGLDIGENHLDWREVIGWAMVDLGDIIEFVVHSTKFSHQFYYFYIPESNPAIRQLIMLLAQYAPYAPEVGTRNILHTSLRRIGLK
jgi:hypothetical protein